MSIASEITSIGENLKKDYQAIANLGADLTNVDKNIENIAGLLDGVYDNLPKTEYQEGTEVNLGKTTKGKLDFDNGVVGIGQSSQDGTPTPDNEVPIQCVTGNQDVVVSGINVVPVPQYIGGEKTQNQTLRGVTLQITDEGYRLTGSNTGQYDADFYLFQASQNKELLYIDSPTCSVNIEGIPSGVTVLISGGDNNGFPFTQFTQSSFSLAGATITDTSKPFNYIIIRVPVGVSVDTTIKVQIEKGSTIHTCEPYITPTSYQLSLGDNKFYGIPNTDYKDELIYDVDEDKVYKKAYVGETEITSSSSITYEASLTNVSRFSVIIENVENAVNSGEAYCNYFTLINGWTLDSEHFYIYGTSSTKKMYFFIDNGTASSLTELQTWLANKTIKVVYVLITPTLTEITDTNLHNQVKALYNAHSLNGTTIITSNGNLPMIIKVRGLKGE